MKYIQLTWNKKTKFFINFRKYKQVKIIQQPDKLFVYILYEKNSSFEKNTRADSIDIYEN